MKIFMLFLSILFIYPSFSYSADLLPKRGFSINIPKKSHAEGKCHYDIEIGNIALKKKEIQKIGCEKDFIISYINSKKIYEYSENEASEMNFRFINEKKGNKVYSLIVVDEYVGYNRRRNSFNKEFESGIPVIIKYDGLDIALRNIYFKITYWK